MRRGGSKDEAPDKVMGPLFPRLHVNDTVKGGPRAPPRNKMALYEQFSVPSHRISSAAAPPGPAPAPRGTPSGPLPARRPPPCHQRRPARDRLNKDNVADRQHSEIESYQTRGRKENAVETQNPAKAEKVPSSKPYAGMVQSGDSDLLGRGLRVIGEKRKMLHHGVDQNDDLSESSVESLPEMEISPDDVVGAIGPKHFWKARRAIVK
ncbi:hypothetical protein HU200_020766 [Digitaria exilis]|uniref:Uncharacterized protein n=1 Tax=Digitaria exilis TaxID=1010633 RepID=A0A835KDI6_9POAL|nr:hypothetical protein HU200_020766 [Digitaria exilis]